MNSHKARGLLFIESLYRIEGTVGECYHIKISLINEDDFCISLPGIGISKDEYESERNRSVIETIRNLEEYGYLSQGNAQNALNGPMYIRSFLSRGKLSCTKGKEIEEGRWYVFNGYIDVEDNGDCFIRDLEGFEWIQYRTRLGRFLKKSFSLPSLMKEDVSLNGVFAGLSEYLNEGEAVEVYNAGQGSCNAIKDRDDNILAFFDVGSGKKLEAEQIIGKIEQKLSRLRYVIISHWDLDHIKMGRGLFGLVKDRDDITWLVPDQYVSPYAHSFACEILGSSNKLFVFKYEGKKKPGLGLEIGGNCYLEMPKNPSMLKRLIDWLSGRRDRNSTGLVMRWKYCLFTGDTDYRFISPRLKDSNGLRLLIAPHHGAKTKSMDIQNNSDQGWFICSVGGEKGKVNRYGHPDSQHIDRAKSLGWTTIETKDGGDFKITQNEDGFIVEREIEQ